jgi:hypothetical protein
MSPTLTNPSIQTAISNSVNHRMKFYSAAAIAAGVGLLALAPPAEGEVVVTRKTIRLISIQEGVGLTGIDFNNDGVNDVSFGINSFGPYSYVTESVFLKVPKGNGVETSGEGRDKIPLVSPLLRGAGLGPSARFNPGNPYASLLYAFQNDHSVKCSNQRFSGHWLGNNPDRFVGVKFLINGATHYGWVRITVATSTVGSACVEMSAIITSYAYETVANKKITIGVNTDTAEAMPARPTEPPRKNPSLGILALGAEGLAMWRPQDTLTSN